MSTASNRHLLRARIAEALADLLLTKPHRAIGRDLGVAGTTVGSRGAEPNAWPLMDALDLAASHEAIGNAVIAYVRGEQTTKRHGEAVRLRSELIRELSEHADLDQKILSQLDHSTPEGRRAIRDAFAHLHDHEAELLADLDAMDRTHGSDR